MVNVWYIFLCSGTKTPVLSLVRGATGTRWAKTIWQTQVHQPLKWSSIAETGDAAAADDGVRAESTEEVSLTAAALLPPHPILGVFLDFDPCDS